MNVDTDYQPPVAVMQTAVTPQNDSEPLQFYWTPSDFNSQFYVYMHFAEVVRLQNNQYRAFYVNLANQFWNLSGNQFSGLIPQELLHKMNRSLELSADGYLFGTPNPCEVDQCKRKRSKKVLVPLVVSLAASLIILAALILVLKLRTKSRRTKQNVENSEATSNRKDGFLETKNMRYTYPDILKMTNNFQRVLGQGGFGTVYQGVIDGKQVAVKLLSESSAQGYHEFHSEAEVLTRVHHRNLTSLVGYCYEDTHLALVYEYMANGNLRARLSVSDDNVLGWLQRLQIALDAAQGLDYLHNHCTPAIIHRDIKSTNILLNEHFEAKLADFGLSRVFNGSSVVTRVVGTPGYLDPEYHETERLHEKSDIYSFGILMLELITGRQVITRIGDKRYIYQWVNFWLERGDIRSIMDPKLRGMYDINSAWKASELAMACASSISVKRPTMAYVLTELAECLAAERARAGGQYTDSEHILPVNSGVLETEVASR